MYISECQDREGVSEIMEAIVNRIPPPKGDVEEPLKALIFDSHFNPYKGVISYVRIFNGFVEPGMHIKMMSTGKEFEVIDVGCFTPGMQSTGRLSSGDVGYIAAGMKRVDDASVGDTITDASRTAAPLARIQEGIAHGVCRSFPCRYR